MTGCLVDRCDGAVTRGAPIALCDAHVVLVGEWDAGRRGVVDVLSSPCVVCGAREGVHLPTGWLCAVCEWRHGEVADGELAPPRVDVVYYLRFADRVKIGTTANPRQRFAALRHDELLGFERGDRTLERRRHAQFADERWPRTEWFRLTERLAAHIEAVAAGTDDPWRRHARWVSEAWSLRA